MVRIPPVFYPWFPLPLYGVSYRLLLALVVFTFSFASPARASLIVGGDPIGSDSSLTDNTGGFTAVQSGSDNLGQPAVLIPLTGLEFLTELRVVVFGLASSSGNLLFDQFDYRLDFWQSDDYLGGADAEFSIILGDPTNVTLIQTDAMTIVPEAIFGNAGPSGDDASTYDFRFDLTRLPEGEPTQQLLKMQLAAGAWVLGLQSWHSTDTSGIFRVTGSNAAEGPLPLFSRGNSSTRGILGGQDPDNIFLRWAISVAASDTVPGDFNLDNVVDADDLTLWENSFDLDANADEDGKSDGADFLLWQRYLGVELIIPGDFNKDRVVDGNDLVFWENSFGVDGGADVDEDGDSDGNDFLVWQRYVGIGANGVVARTVPEPDAVLLMLGGILPCGWCLSARR